MTDRPIADFFLVGSSIKRADDLAIYLYLVGLQEYRWPLSVSARARLNSWCPEITDDQAMESLDRLIESGEVRRATMEDTGMDGLLVVRFESLLDSITEFGRRRYQRLAAKKSREKRCGVTV